MSNRQVRVQFGSKEGLAIFKLESLTFSISLSYFACPIAEYNKYLTQDVLRSQNDYITRTWLLCERATGAIAAYMSLIIDAIKLSFTEKELHNLNYPFNKNRKTISMRKDMYC